MDTEIKSRGARIKLSNGQWIGRWDLCFNCKDGELVRHSGSRDRDGLRTDTYYCNNCDEVSVRRRNF